VLVAAGADVNALTSQGLTPLHTARHGQVAARAPGGSAHPLTPGTHADGDRRADLLLTLPRAAVPLLVVAAWLYLRGR